MRIDIDMVKSEDRSGRTGCLLRKTRISSKFLLHSVIHGIKMEKIVGDIWNSWWLNRLHHNIEPIIYG